jgi:hypothetical protein
MLQMSIIDENVFKKQPTQQHTNYIKGIAICNVKLNVRQSPNPTGEIIHVINRGDKFNIDLDKSTDRYYYIKFSRPSKIKGFVAKEYVEVL